MTKAAADLRRELAAREPEARRLAAQRIAAVIGPEATGLLLLALGDDDWRVRKEAAGVAPALAGREELVRALAFALDEKENVGLRNAAVEALVLVGIDAVPAAVSALESLDADGRKLAAEILAGVPDPRGTRALARALVDPDPNVRCAAAEALGASSSAGEEARERAIVALTSALGSSEELLKLASLDALARLDAKLPWSVFEPLASDPLLRKHAILAAARSRDRAAVLALAGAVSDRSVAIARDALVALVDCMDDDPGDEVVEAARAILAGSAIVCARIREMAGAEDARLRGAALVLLGLLRDPSDVPVLAGALADEDVAHRAELGLRMFGREAAVPLIEVGRRSIPPVRAFTLSLMPHLVPRGDGPTLAALHDALMDTSPEVVIAAIKVIAVSGTGEDIARVAGFATHADPRVSATSSAALNVLSRRHPADAKAALRGIDPADERAIVACVVLGAVADESVATWIGPEDVRFLRAAVAESHAKTRRAAVDALAAIGDETAADAVALAIADEEPDVSLAAVRALGRMGRAEPLAALIASAHDAPLVAAALRALSEASPARAFDAAQPLIRSSDPVLACAAVEALGSLRGPRRGDVLFLALAHPDVDVVKAALSELSRDVDARSVARFGMCLDHPSWDVRRLAAELLGNDASPAATALLRGRLERETDTVVREALTAAVTARPADAKTEGEAD